MTPALTTPPPALLSQVGTPIRVKWSNELRDPATGACLPHIIDAVDQTLHWAYPQVRLLDGWLQLWMEGLWGSCLTGAASIRPIRAGRRRRPRLEPLQKGLLRREALPLQRHHGLQVRRRLGATDLAC